MISIRNILRIIIASSIYILSRRKQRFLFTIFTSHTSDISDGDSFGFLALLIIDIKHKAQHIYYVSSLD